MLCRLDSYNKKHIIYSYYYKHDSVCNVILITEDFILFEILTSLEILKVLAHQALYISWVSNSHEFQQYVSWVGCSEWKKFCRGCKNDFCYAFYSYVDIWGKLGRGTFFSHRPFSKMALDRICIRYIFQPNICHIFYNDLFVSNFHMSKSCYNLPYFPELPMDFFICGRNCWKFVLADLPTWGF